MKIIAITGIWLALMAGVALAGEEQQAQVWRRWEHALTSAKRHANPYADLTLKVVYRGPGGRVIRGYGFWDGGQRFVIRCAFPAAGEWTWETVCSDESDAGLHGKRGTVRVVKYAGNNPLYTHGFLRISENRRYLMHDDKTPFLWIGDTAWAGPMQASEGEWKTYLADRAAKHFTVVQVAPAPQWAGKTDREGNKPFVDESIGQWEPAFWRAFDRKVQAANEAGMAVMLVGLMEPTRRYPESARAQLFARNIVARLFGDFVMFSPSFDSNFMPLANDVGRAAREATAVHLITQHPGTPSAETTPTFSIRYFDEPYLDFAGVQSGHNGGNLDRCAHHAIEWTLNLYRREPHKPVVNLEAMYDAQGEKGWRAVDARSLGWRTMLSGACGYTYGAGDMPPKVPGGNGAIWRWVTDPSKYDYWEKAMRWDSATQMTHLHDFLAAIEWWRLEPAHELIRNQPKDVTRRMVLARIGEGDLAVAYLPESQTIEIDMSKLPKGMRKRWFDPVQGRFAGEFEKVEGERFEPPGKGDWVLMLKRQGF